MSRATFLWLLSLVCVLVFVALQPLLTYALFGSDTGEYYRLTATLLSTGHLPRGASYIGWGQGYQDFPGIFLLAGASAGAVGTDAFSALTIVIPVVAVLSVLPLFLLFRRLFPNDTIALLGAGFSSLAMPRLFSIAHPAPLALGDFLVVAGLWMFVEGRRDRRWYLPLALTSGALVITHHLSSYFFLVSSLGGLLLLELWRPGLWSRRFPLRELVFLGGFLTFLFAFWFGYATSFRPELGQGLPGISAPSYALFEAAGILGVVLVGLVIRWRRRRPVSSRVWVKVPSDRIVLRDAIFLLVAIFGGISLLLILPLPGTSQMTNPSAILFFTPVLVLGVLAAGSRRLLTTSRLGPYALVWMGALGLSAFVALATKNTVILASRHVEYLFLPLGLLVAAGVGRLLARWREPLDRRALIAGSLAVVLLLAANAAIAYPPQADFGGFEEGLTSQDATLWMWVGIAIPIGAVVASDHRLSSMVFGFDGNRATWDSTPYLFTGKDWSLAAAELNRTDAPHNTSVTPNMPVNAVAIDSVMFGGVALDPSAFSAPLSAASKLWFQAPPFVLLYQNGPQAVYWVDGPVVEGS